MKKILGVLLLMLLSISIFSWVNIPILDANKLFEVKGTIDEINTHENSRFIFLTLKDKVDFKAIFPNAPILEKWFENNTNITLYGYYVELKTDKYFIPVKIDYKNKTVDLRKEIAKRLYQRKQYQDMIYHRKLMEYRTPYPHMQQYPYPYNYNYKFKRPGFNQSNRYFPTPYYNPYKPPIK
ncbi:MULTISPECIES: hypothetical protein [unclassified Marinitoga]|uniref:hypothetical protein n=1 Tax=unclassified Marinitoga TaxID=2640159 RepID=UPI000640F36E|nr:MULTISPECIES: hypothetical protein [unclassified Marinitoga]KLO25169.1 hypothetical protein X274_00730 [Marinitoga sp. 1155]NUU98655.1 hypothetical protein [Marinitoga sp. 1154]